MVVSVAIYKSYVKLKSKLGNDMAMHTCICVLFTLMANSGTLVGEGSSRAGGAAGRSWFCTVGAGFTMETL